ncbi:FAD-binding oxidoreductase [Streptomyces sporangiiformans]|uniref:FAD-binding oxidoreductase n=1 Tax=Streptomyces sporangiiformans TaxID=2315329 RepID=A0A505DDJ9_9ACTN|nr:FAD-binding oxidoreductase [Streptomyces sporangiiformans]TPQ18648.1 FAD-binding oxidoreductase [Streptomyces sporangiiformans]
MNEDYPRGAETASSGPISDDFAARLHGRLIRPQDPDYEPTRALWNGMIDRRPALVARCRGDDDVVASVNFARDNGLPLAVRGGGHGVAGQAVCDGGLVVDLSEMTDTDIDPDGLTGRAQGGCTLADLDRATQRYGLAAPMGVVSATGIAGLTLSGGMGWLRRKYGLSCDNLVSASVVTADGRLLTASENENEDLFWAIRGGGGNFGVVTSFDYRLHPVGPRVFLCNVYYPLERAAEVLRACERYVAEVPEEAAPLAVVGRIPRAEAFPAAVHGEPFVALLAVSPGAGGAAAEEGERALRPLREVTEPLCDLSEVTGYTEAQQFLDEDYPDGRLYYWKSVNAPELSDKLIERLTEHAAAAPSPDSTIDVWYQGGAMARVGEQETAFANRDVPYLFGIEGNWDREGDSERNVAWVRDTFADLRHFSTGGVYLNFPGFLEEGEQLLREGYGGNYERLSAVKAKYDPGNLFRLNANIQPTQGN